MRHLRTTRLAFVATLALCFSFVLAQGDDAEALEVVEGAVQRWEDGIEQQDAVAMAQLFTEDGSDFSEGAETHGREALQQSYQGAFDAGVIEIPVEVTEAGLIGDTAYGAGTFVVMGAEGEVFNEGNWTGIYKKEGGEWKIHRLMGTAVPCQRARLAVARCLVEVTEL